MQFSKDLIAASSTPIVLAILSEGDSYGYAIIKRVREVSGGHMEWTDGMLYPVLHRLERLGFVKAHWKLADSGRRRKYYRLTSQGRTQLAEERRQWQAVDATLRGIWRSLSLDIALHGSTAWINPKHESRNPKQILMTKYQNVGNRKKKGFDLCHLGFEFVSNFVLDISCFPQGMANLHSGGYVT